MLVFCTCTHRVQINCLAVKMAQQCIAHRERTALVSDSAPFWKGILDIGLLEPTIHEMKVQLSTIKRRILASSDVSVAGAFRSTANLL